MPFISVPVFLSESGCPGGRSAESAQLPDIQEDNDQKAIDSSQYMDYCLSKLTEKGYRKETADAIAQTNKTYFRLLYEENRQQLDALLTDLSRLARLKKSQEKIAKYPELTSLIANALTRDSGATEKILSTIPALEEDAEVVFGMYQFAGSEEECLKLADVLNAFGELMIEIKKKCFNFPVAWLMDTPEDKEAAAVYKWWIKELFTYALENEKQGQDDAIENACSIFTIHADTIRNKLVKDASFREPFRESYWPAFFNILNAANDNELKWGEYVADSRIWEFCSKFGSQQFGNNHNDWAELFSRYGGTVVDLFLGYQDPLIQDFIIQLLERNEPVLPILSNKELQADFRFQHLLKRNIAFNNKVKAITTLAQNLPQAPLKLKYYNSQTDQALDADLFDVKSTVLGIIPGYSVYELSKKMAQGREVSYGDYFSATLDIVSAIPVLKGAKFGLPLIQRKLVGAVVKKDAVALTDDIAKKGIEELYPWVVRETFRTGKIIAKSIKNYAAIDCTNLTRLMFKKSGAGNATIKRLTGLDARVFMRSDRSVVMDFPLLLKNDHVFGRVMRETAANAGVNVGAEVAGDAGEIVVKQVINAFEAQGQKKAWRENLSAWWVSYLDPSVALKG